MYKKVRPCNDLKIKKGSANTKAIHQIVFKVPPVEIPIWKSTLNSVYPPESFRITSHPKESGNILYKIVIVGQEKTKPSLTISIYETGTIMVQGDNTMLETFGFDKFEAWKTGVVFITDNTHLTPLKFVGSPTRVPGTPYRVETSPLNLTTPSRNTATEINITPKVASKVTPNQAPRHINEQMKNRLSNLEDELIKTNTNQREFVETVQTIIVDSIKSAVDSAITSLWVKISEKLDKTAEPSVESNNDKATIVDNIIMKIDSLRNDNAILLEKEQEIQNLITKLHISSGEIETLRSDFKTLADTESALRTELKKTMLDCKNLQGYIKMKHEASNQQKNNATTQTFTPVGQVQYKPQDKHTEQHDPKSLRQTTRLSTISEHSSDVKATNEVQYGNVVQFGKSDSGLSAGKQQTWQNADLPHPSSFDLQKETLLGQRETHGTHGNNTKREIPLFIIGDSMIGSLKTREFRDERYTKIHTMRGKRIEDAVDFLENECDFTVTEHCILHFATNNLQDKANNQEELIGQILEKYKALVNVARTKFPKAQIHISAILSRFDMCDVTEQIIEIINSQLKTIADEDSMLSFIDHTYIDNRKWLIRQSDKLHLTWRGSECLSRDFEYAVRNGRNSKTDISYTSGNETHRNDPDSYTYSGHLDTYNKQNNRISYNRDKEPPRWRYTSSDSNRTEYYNRNGGNQRGYDTQHSVQMAQRKPWAGKLSFLNK